MFEGVFLGVIGCAVFDFDTELFFEMVLDSFGLVLRELRGIQGHNIMALRIVLSIYDVGACPGVYTSHIMVMT